MNIANAYELNCVYSKYSKRKEKKKNSPKKNYYDLQQYIAIANKYL